MSAGKCSPPHRKHSFPPSRTQRKTEANQWRKDPSPYALLISFFPMWGSQKNDGREVNLFLEFTSMALVNQGCNPKEQVNE